MVGIALFLGQPLATILTGKKRVKTKRKKCDLDDQTATALLLKVANYTSLATYNWKQVFYIPFDEEVDIRFEVFYIFPL